jgi:hypothetical protein
VRTESPLIDAAPAAFSFAAPLSSTSSGIYLRLAPPSGASSSVVRGSRSTVPTSSTRPLSGRWAAAANTKASDAGFHYPVDMRQSGSGTPEGSLAQHQMHNAGSFFFHSALEGHLAARSDGELRSTAAAALPPGTSVMSRESAPDVKTAQVVWGRSVGNIIVKIPVDPTLIDEASRGKVRAHTCYSS